MFKFLLVVHIIIAVSMVGVILMQRSEGGGLAGGGSPAGLMSARGAADFLTRTTTILATLFIVLSVALAALATVNRAPRELDTSLTKQPGAVPAMPAPPPTTVPLAGGAQPAPAAPETKQQAPVVPLAAPATKPAASEKPAAKPKPVEAAKPQAKKPVAAPAPAVEKPVVVPAAPAPAAPAPAPNPQ